MKHINEHSKPLRSSWRLLSVLLLLQFCISSARAQDTCNKWDALGGVGFSDGTVSGASLYISHQGEPYVAYRDAANGNKATVTHFAANSWKDLGYSGLDPDVVDNPRIAPHGSIVYMVYRRSIDNLPRVAMTTGSVWTMLNNTGISTGAVADHQIALTSTGTPYIAYEDVANSNKITVKKYNGSGWTTVGTTGFSSGAIKTLDLFIDASDSVWVSYIDIPAGNITVVKKYRGTSWVQIGNTSTASSPWTGLPQKSTSLAVHNGIPYISMAPDPTSNPTYGGAVLKYTGAAWSIVGYFAINLSVAQHKIAINGSGIPYVAYSDEDDKHLTVSRYNATTGDLDVIGGANLSNGATGAIDLAINGSGVPYVAYKDVPNSNKMTARVLTTTTVAAITGSDMLCVDNTIMLSDATSGGSWSSSDPAIASVDMYGLVTGVSDHYLPVTISYTKNSCAVTHDVLVGPKVIITGDKRICVGSEGTLSCDYSGTWTTASSKISMPTTTGYTAAVAGVSTGTARITFTSDWGGCVVRPVITVSAVPGEITGIKPLCAGGSSITLANSVPGGIWRVDTSSGIDASISGSGVLTPGTVTGLVNIFYSTGDPGICAAYAYTYVNTPPGPITGNAPICPGSLIAISVANTNDEGGTWSSSNTAKATVTSPYYPWEAHLVGISSGTAVITYKNGEGAVCRSTVVATVYPVPVISGPASFPSSGTATLTCNIPGGTWSSDASWRISINSTTGVMSWGGVSYGSASIQYTTPTGCYASKTVTVIALRNGENSLEERPTDGIQLYPNPNNGAFTLSGTLPGTGNGAVSVTVTDILGRTVYTDELYAVADRINKELKVMNTPCAGMYLLTLSSDNEKKVIRFTIE
ncbi:hypothetical protein GCM10023093_01760 [Nemorincola caseinilytica]|uniref:Secretion system C-terminal sorting domain-containing protein n=1 Tax=Nemorincola caseinilytica TaxID=2054315 RepID=A0ABP8N5L8_9BACT